MFHISRSSRGHLPNAAIVPVTDFVLPCHLVPRFPSGAINPLWIRGQAMSSADSFYLNRYIDLRVFDLYHIHHE